MQFFQQIIGNRSFFLFQSNNYLVPGGQCKGSNDRKSHQRKDPEIYKYFKHIQ